MSGQQYFLDNDKRVNSIPVDDYKFKLELYNGINRFYVNYFEVKCGDYIEIK
jgi:hypothetical protein